MGLLLLLRWGSLVGRVDGSESDVREVDCGVGLLVLDVAGGSRVVGAGTAVAAGNLGVAADGVVCVEPEHVGEVVVPQAHHKHVPTGKGLSHRLKTSLLEMVVVVSVGGLGIGAEVGGDGVV